jgi:hypothetical protein
LKAASAVVVSQTLPLPMSAWKQTALHELHVEAELGVATAHDAHRSMLVSVGSTRASTVKVPLRIARRRGLEAYPVLPLKPVDGVGIADHDRPAPGSA